MCRMKAERSFYPCSPAAKMAAVVAGSHNACVCTYYENIKLMPNTVNTSLNYKDALKLCVYSTENSDCMLHHFGLCPEQTVV